MSQRCPVCDRTDCGRLTVRECICGEADCPWATALDQCRALRVNWRARALAAEAERDAIDHRHRTYADGIAEAIGGYRQMRQSGEPARSDRAEIEALQSEIRALRVHIEALLEAGEDKMSPVGRDGLSCDWHATADAARKVLGE